MIWPIFRRNKIQAERDDAFAEIRAAKAVFQQAMKAATAAGSAFDQTFALNVVADFGRLETEAQQAKTAEHIEKLLEEAKGLARLRAYVCPPDEIKISGETQLNVMEDWSVPPGALDALRRQVVPQLASTNVNAARGALCVILGEYDSWSDYTDEYSDEMRAVAFWLGGLSVACLLGAIFLLSNAYVIVGLLLGGTCGAFVSVLTKLPTLSAYGQSTPYGREVWRRVCAGIAASVIGSGFLASGIVTVTLPQGGSLPNMMATCAQPHAASTPEASKEPTQSQTFDTSCRSGNVLILVAIAMLFGFSERALTAFEARVFPSKL